MPQWSRRLLLWDLKQSYVLDEYPKKSELMRPSVPPAPQSVPDLVPTILYENLNKLLSRKVTKGSIIKNRNFKGVNFFLNAPLLPFLRCPNHTGLCFSNVQT